MPKPVVDDDAPDIEQRWQVAEGGMAHDDHVGGRHSLDRLDGIGVDVFHEIRHRIKLSDHAGFRVGIEAIRLGVVD